MSKVVPKQKPGKSEQNVGTPPEFISAVERRFGKLYCDLAATADNTKSEKFITPEEDSLSVDWTDYERCGGRMWLNPPYGDIEPWVKKCSETNLSKDGYPRDILVLIPAAVSTNYFKNYIFDKCLIYFISPRIKFIGHEHTFPKDLMLLVYTSDLYRIEKSNWIECWRWDEYGTKMFNL